MMNFPNLIFALIMGFLMSATITFATTFVRIGSAENFFGIWFGVWLVAYPVAIAGILIYKPFASKITAMLIKRLKLNEF
jgi:ABC-type thiamin/hydroxymethylpyrimidine transport system permease subunit